MSHKLLSFLFRSTHKNLSTFGPSSLAYGIAVLVRFRPEPSSWLCEPATK